MFECGNLKLVMLMLSIIFFRIIAQNKAHLSTFIILTHASIAFATLNLIDSYSNGAN